MNGLQQLLKDGRGSAVVHVPAALDGPVRVEEREGGYVSHWTVASSSRDREGDTIDPRGCLPTIKNYARNPVVLWEHGKYSPFPIGQSIGDGTLPLIVSADSIRAGVKHDTSTEVGRDVLRLVQSGVLRGASLGFLPLKARQIGERRTGSLNSPRFHFEQFDVTEFSLCAVPMNADCVRRELSAGRIESPIMRKALTAMADGSDPRLDALQLALDVRGAQIGLMGLQIGNASIRTAILQRQVDFATAIHERNAAERLEW